MVLAWFPITSSWNTACYIRGLIYGIGRGVPNGVSPCTSNMATYKQFLIGLIYGHGHNLPVFIAFFIVMLIKLNVVVY